MSVLLERLVVAIEAMSMLVIRQEGHVYLAAKLAQQTTGAATELGYMCAEHQLGAEVFKPHWES
jgi:regulatory protein YycI of two-component signal transduction system YycFG